MKKRVISGAVLVIFLLAIVVFNRIFPFALNMAISCIAATAVWEIIFALQVSKKYFLFIPSIFVSISIPLLGRLEQRLAVFIYSILFFCVLLFYHKQTSFKEIGILYSTSLMIPLALSTLIPLRNLGGSHGMFYVIVAILSAWVADMGGLFVGKFLGKHPLSPQISPKKTIEGAVGGFIINVLCMMFVGFLFSGIYYTGKVAVSYGVLALIGGGSSLFSILGDLSFSLIKRSCHIKDFGEIIPGHGGILDRFDSVIFVAPFVYFVVSYLPIVIQ